MVKIYLAKNYYLNTCIYKRLEIKVVFFRYMYYSQEMGRDD